MAGNTLIFTDDRATTGMTAAADVAPAGGQVVVVHTTAAASSPAWEDVAAEAGSFVAAYSRHVTAGTHDAFTFMDGMAKVFAALQPGAQLIHREVVRKADSEADRRTLDEVVLDLGLAGFVSVTAELQHDGCTVFTASKPTWTTGAAASVAIKPAAPVESKAQDVAKTWSILSSDDTAAVDLADEDALLAGDVVAKPAAAEGCATKRRACKNCSCGRAEVEAAADAAASTAAAAALKLSLDDDTVAKPSSCGNCYKGDAFRCGSCPYRGMPAFEPGTTVKLDLSADA